MDAPPNPAKHVIEIAHAVPWTGYQIHGIAAEEAETNAWVPRHQPAAQIDQDQVLQAAR